MFKMRKTVRTLIPFLLLPVCVHMGIKQEEMELQAHINNTETVINTTETTCKNEVKPLSWTAVTDEDTAVSLQELDWTKLGNTLPILDSNETITIDENLQTYIYNLANEFDVPYELILSVCYMESKFTAEVNNEGLNYDGTTDYGIMGLNDRYLQSNCNLYNNGIMIDPYNAYQNIYIGVQILASNLNYFNGNIYDAANAYNLGPGGWEDMKYSGQSWYYGDTVLEYISTLEDTLKTKI